MIHVKAEKKASSGSFLWDHLISLGVLLALGMLPWFRLGLFENTIWYWFDSPFRFFPFDAAVASLSAISPTFGSYGLQNAGLIGAFPMYALASIGNTLGLPIVALNRLVFIVPWLFRGVGMYLLLSVIDRSGSRWATFAKFLASFLYQFAPIGDPFTSNISSVTAGAAPVALAIFIRGAASHRWFRYAVVLSVWFALATATGFSIPFLPVLVFLYALIVFPRSKNLRHNLAYLATCLSLMILSIAYFLIPWLYSLANDFTYSPLNPPAREAWLETATREAIANGLQYTGVGLNIRAWHWGPLYAEPLFYFSLLFVTVLAYLSLLIRRSRITIYLAILGVGHILLAAALAYPALKDLYLILFRYLPFYLPSLVYLLYPIWLASCTLLGLGLVKLFSSLSPRKRLALSSIVVAAVATIAFPMVTVADGILPIPPDGFPIPAEYYQLHDALLNAPVGSRILELPIPNWDYDCYGQISPGFTWSVHKGCYDTWIAKMMPLQVLAIEDKSALDTMGYEKLYLNFQKGDAKSEEQLAMMRELNIRYIFLHKDFVSPPAWVTGIGERLRTKDSFRLLASNEFYDLYEANLDGAAMYALRLPENLHIRARLQDSKGERTALILINSGSSVKLHPSDDEQDAKAAVDTRGGTYLEGGEERGTNRFLFQFYLDNDLEETSPIVVYDDGASFWEPWSAGNGSYGVAIGEETGIKMRGASSLEMTIGTGSSAIVGVNHNFSPPQDWRGKEFIALYWHGVNNGASWLIKVESTAAYHEWRFSDDFNGWRRIVKPMSNPIASGGTLDLSDIRVIRIHTKPSAKGTTYVDRALVDEGQWTKVEILEPDGIIVNKAKLKAIAYDANEGKYRPNPFVSDAGLDGSELRFMDGTLQAWIHANFSKGAAFYGWNSGGQTQPVVTGDTEARSITYSNDDMAKGRIGFAIKMPPDDGQDAPGGGISQILMNIEVTYEFDTSPSAIDMVPTLNLLPSTLSGWKATVNNSSPSVVALTQIFGKQWEAYLDGKRVPESYHFLVDGYANGWVINATTGPTKIEIRNSAQPYLYLGAGISAVFWVLAPIIVFGIPFLLGRHRRFEKSIS